MEVVNPAAAVSEIDRESDPNDEEEAALKIQCLQRQRAARKRVSVAKCKRSERLSGERQEERDFSDEYEEDYEEEDIEEEMPGLNPDLNP